MWAVLSYAISVHSVFESQLQDLGLFCMKLKTTYRYRTYTLLLLRPGANFLNYLTNPI